MSAATIQVDGYSILGSLGQGGMGQLFRAEKLDSHQVVAIKVIHSHLTNDPQIVKRFDREASTLSKLEHPSIVRIVERGKTASGQLYLVMEFVEGHPLRHWISDKRLTVAECARVIQLVCESLDYAHSHNVLHRDIKPENILLNKSGNHLAVKVLDFGLAAAAERSADEPELTAAGAVIGTAHYMSPEQRLDPRKVDARTDVYALGVLFYELLSGSPPRGAYRLPSETNLFASPVLDPIVEKMMAPEAQHRYQSATEVLAALERACAAGLTRTPDEVAAAKAKLATSTLGGSHRAAPADSTPPAPVSRPATSRSSQHPAASAARPASRVPPLAVSASGTGPGVPVFTALPASAPQPTLAVEGRCLPGARVHVKVGGKDYPTLVGAQGQFSVTVDLHEGDNTLVAWSEADGARSADSPLQHVRYTPGGAPPPPAPPPPPPERKDEPWNPSTPRVYDPPVHAAPSRAPTDASDPKRVLFLVFVVLATLVAVVVVTLAKRR